MLLLATAGNYAVISVIGAIDVPGAEALNAAFDWLDGETVIIVSLEACTDIAAPSLETFSRRGDEQGVVFVQPEAAAPLGALRRLARSRALHVARDLPAAVQLAGSLEGGRMLPFVPIAMHLN